MRNARARREVREDIDVEVIVGMMIGSLYAAHLSRATIPRGWLARVVKMAFEGLC